MSMLEMVHVVDAWVLLGCGWVALDLWLCGGSR